MSDNIQSRFISLSPYCLVEYMAEPLNSPNVKSEDFILIKNNNLGIYQIYNEDISLTKTGNIQDLSVVNINQNTVVYLDSEKTPHYTAFNDSLVVSNITGFNVVYDRVRFHFITGFDFEGFEALVLSVRNQQNDGENHVFANILLAPETINQIIKFNPRPIFLSDTTYDRYVDVLVPSIKNINDEYLTAPLQSATFVAAITPNETGGSIGFVTNSPITLNLSECNNRSSISTGSGVKYVSFDVTENYTGTVSQTNEFDGVGATVREADTGDFIEYYLTFNDAFPEDFISILNNRNPADDWMIIHQLSIFEQLGSSFINTSRLVVFQDDNFDEPLVFRPVLKNAGSAVSMSIDLLCRLTNRRNGEQIIREASWTMLSPKKYGKSLINMPLSNEPQSHKIYNKLIKKNFEATKLFIEPEFDPSDPHSSPTSKTIKSIEYLPVYVNNNNISISNNSGYVSLNDRTDEVIFGPGKLRFSITPFDNIVKLKMFNVVNAKAIPLDLNLNGSKYNIVFTTDSGKIKIGNANSENDENLSTGILRFEISQTQSDSILKSKDKTMYITSVSQDGRETVMYSGEWRKSSEQSDIDSAITSAKEETDAIRLRDEKISQLEEKINSLAQSNSYLSWKVTEYSNSIKNVGTPSIVNMIKLKDPKKVTTTASNAGKNINK